MPELWVSVQADAKAPAPNEKVLDVAVEVAMPTSLAAQMEQRGTVVQCHMYMIC